MELLFTESPGLTRWAFYGDQSSQRRERGCSERASYELLVESELRIGQLAGLVDRGTSVSSGVRAVYHAGDDAALASSRSCSIAKIAVLCPDPIASLRRTASQEVVFKEAALLVEELRAGSSMLALVVSSLVASLARLCLMPVAGSRAHAVLSATCAYRVEALGELRLMC